LFIFEAVLKYPQYKRRNEDKTMKIEEQEGTLFKNLTIDCAARN
jgi:hypothetical protein